LGDKTRRSLANAVLVSLLCVATTCDSPVRVDVGGDIESGVTFRVFDLANGGRLVPVEELVVGELYGDDVWRLQGRATMREFAYGQPIEGLIAQLGPRPLERGKTYYVVVSGGQRWRRGHYGTYTFTLDQHGRVTAAPLDVRAPTD
jgi:hypothetical protein